MRPSPIAHRYAQAAFDVAQNNNETEVWLSELREAGSVLSEPSAGRFFKDPNRPRSEKLQALENLFPRFRPQVINLLRMLAVRNRLGLLPAVLREVEALDREARGILEAEVTVGRRLTEDERSAVESRLQQATGKQVSLRTHVDPSILGGIIVRIGDRLFDASVAGRLDRLRHRMAA